MKNSVLYAIIAIIVVGAGGGIAFAAMSMTDSDSGSSQGQVRTVKHAMGSTEITEVPERIVVLEWTYAEDLLALGIQPVGVADIDGMNKWVQMKELALSPDVVDVGTRQEPNLEKISQLNPDLIITDKHRSQDTYDDLSVIAPTIAFDPYRGEQEDLDHLTEMEQTLMTIADVVGRHDAGVAAIERMNDSFDRAAQQLREAGRDEEFLVVQAYTSPVTNGAEMRIFTENSIPAQIMSRLGVENAWDVQYELYGFSTVGLEALADVDHADFFYVVQDDDNVFANEWDNPVWQNLQFVKEGRTYPLSGDTWLFGGPISAEIFAEKVADALASDSETKTVAHAMGETEMPETPKRVVALQWNYVENLLALGVEPVGVAEIETMEKFVSLGDLALSDNVVDVGSRYEPNLELIAQLEPDLIIGDYSGNGKTYEQLSEIAPTILFDPYPAKDDGIGRLQEMEQTFMTMADIVGRHDRGVAVLERMHEKFDEAKTTVQASDAAGKPFVLVMTGSYKDDYSKFRIWTQNARAAEIIKELGMENAWPVQYEQ